MITVTPPTTAPTAPTLQPHLQQVPDRRFAVVELFGHARVAGEITEQTFGGAHLVRVDVPEVRYLNRFYRAGQACCTEHVIPAHTASYGPAAIYSIQWVDQAAALVAAHDIRHRSVEVYTLRAGMEQMADSVREQLLPLVAPPQPQAGEGVGIDAVHDQHHQHQQQAPRELEDTEADRPF